MQQPQIAFHGIKDDLFIDGDVRCAVFGSPERIFIMQRYGYVDVVLFQEGEVSFEVNHSLTQWNILHDIVSVFLCPDKIFECNNLDVWLDETQSVFPRQTAFHYRMPYVILYSGELVVAFL